MSLVDDVRFVMVSPVGSSECVVKAGGEIDVATCPQFRQVLAEALRGRPRTLAVDMADVEFMGSSGLNVLVDVLKECRELGVDLVIQAPIGRVVRVFEMTGLDKVFRIVV
jgi:anti-sigma B factor antagonist